MAKRILGLMAMGASALALAACGMVHADDGDSSTGTSGTEIARSGDEATRSYDLTGFTGVGLAGSDDVVITQGERFSVTASGPVAVLDKLKLEVRDDSLNVGRVRGLWSRSEGKAVIRITMPALSSVGVAGSGQLRADRLSGEKADVAVAGSGDANIAAVSASALEINIAGSGNVAMAGTARSTEVNIAGSGSMAAPDLTSEQAEVSVAGSGNLAMAVSGEAAISMMGSGGVTLTGGARCTTSRMGSGRVDCS